VPLPHPHWQRSKEHSEDLAEDKFLDDYREGHREEQAPDNGEKCGCELHISPPSNEWDIRNRLALT
jgi:hypothetical protein